MYIDPFFAGIVVGAVGMIGCIILLATFLKKFDKKGKK